MTNIWQGEGTALLRLWTGRPSEAAGRRDFLRLFDVRRKMQDGLVYAPNHLSHTSVIRRFRMVSLLMIVWIPEKQCLLS